MRVVCGRGGDTRVLGCDEAAMTAWRFTAPETARASEETTAVARVWSMPDIWKQKSDPMNRHIFVK